jgi:D-alanine---D-serine ligase
VLTSFDKDKFEPVPVGITREGEWFRFYGDIKKIHDDNWQGEDCVPALITPSRSVHGILEFRDSGTTQTYIDAAMPVLHGKNGEDGTVQGLLELAGIPVVGCGAMASALCMDKDRAHKLVEFAGFRVPKAVTYTSEREAYEQAPVWAEKTGYPLFVKPVKAGSSIGISKVKAEPDFERAIRLAFSHDDVIIIEEAIIGIEVSCAVLGDVELTVGAVDEIEISGDLFDYNEKYTLATSAIHIPARIPEAKAREVQENAKSIFRVLGCTGFARVDQFLTPEGDIVFNEVNTIPGFTEHSQYPSMMSAAGISLIEVITRAVTLAVSK